MNAEVQDRNEAAGWLMRRRIARRLAGRRAEVLERWWANQFQAERLERFEVEGWRGQSPDALRSLYLGPLFDLLLAYLRTGESRFRDVYLDERLRYAPHQASWDTRASFFREVLKGDEEVLLRTLSDESEEAALTQRLADLHAPLLQAASGDAIRLIAVGDCLMNELRVFLPQRSRCAGIDVDVRQLYFSGVVGRSLSAEQILELHRREPADLFALSFLTYEGLPYYGALLREASDLDARERERRVAALVQTVADFLASLREHTDAPFLVHNASGLPLSRWRRRLPGIAPLARSRRDLLEPLNEGLRELVEATPNAILLDEEGLVQRHGHRECAREVIPAHISRQAPFHTARLGELLVDPYLEVLCAYRDLGRAKVLAVDFDNTLWQGVMAEGPVRHHTAAQNLLRRLREAGLLLVAVSKNDPENVRWEEMALPAEDFVLLKIGWDLKAKSIAEAAQELDLGLDSFVLIDDSPEERALVARELPAVRLLDPTRASCWKALEWVLEFPNTRDTDEARSRTELYREQAQRRRALVGDFDYPAMMRSLELEARFGPARQADLERIAELVQRTNQFNTTTRRYTRDELERFTRETHRRIYVGELSDRFGSLGLVGGVIVERRGGAAVIDSFVMSCRAMGFGFEHLLLRLVLESEKGAERFLGRFVPTDRNSPARDLFSDAGFASAGEDEWSLEASEPRSPVPDWFRVVERA